MTLTRPIQVLGACAVLLIARASFAAGLSSNYIAQVITTRTAEPQFARVSLNVDGATLSGLWGDRRVSGTLTGSKLALTLADAAGEAAGVLNGTVSGTTVIGEGTLAPSRGSGGRGGAVGDQLQRATWTLTAYTPPAPFKTDSAQPRPFHSTYSAN